MTLSLIGVIFAIFVYLTMAGAITEKLETQIGFPFGVAIGFGIFWPFAIPFLIGVEISAHYGEPPQGA